MALGIRKSGSRRVEDARGKLVRGERRELPMASGGREGIEVRREDRWHFLCWRQRSR